MQESPSRGLTTMMPSLFDLSSVIERPVPADMTALELTRHMDELVDEQVRQLAALYQRLIADLEERSRHLKRGTRDAWLTKNRPAARAGEPAAIRRRLENLPPCPPDYDDRADIPELRSEPRERGVYLRLRSGCYRNADVRAYDREGQQIDRVCVSDDPILRLGAVRFLWSVLEWWDPVSDDVGDRRP